MEYMEGYAYIIQEPGCLPQICHRAGIIVDESAFDEEYYPRMLLPEEAMPSMKMPQLIVSEALNDGYSICQLMSDGEIECLLNCPYRGHKGECMNMEMG